jgi:epoxyqueuosine reductase
MASFADRIKERAYEIGIDKVGIVSAAPLGDEAYRLDQWVERGFQGTMSWMERDPQKRADPQLLFPRARSVVVVAVNYFTPHEHSQPGKISRYAWGDDYHDVVGGKLSDLLAWVKTEMPSVEGKICVDTSPFMDKAWAVRGGLGWLGKHSNVITKELGSWVFIGSMLLDVELDYDRYIVEDHCGTCTACLDACPTDAIVEPYVVDSKKCISYATIELRDDTLPENISKKLEGWLYGCDICQDVCPWNRFQQATKETRFEPRNGETSVDIDAIISMTHNEYVDRFRRSAIKRTKLTGLKRNAAALKN